MYTLYTLLLPALLYTVAALSFAVSIIFVTLSVDCNTFCVQWNGADSALLQY